jgi:hypothetical protein
MGACERSESLVRVHGLAVWARGRLLTRCAGYTVKDLAGSRSPGARTSSANALEAHLLHSNEYQVHSTLKKQPGPPDP